MRIIKNVTQDEVWNHWKLVENFQVDDFRSDIRDPLPSDTKWYLVLIENTDIGKLYIISSDDWRDISKGTFLVKEVTNNLSSNSSDQHTIRISNDIKEKISFLRIGNLFDTRLIMVANDLIGPFTIIEGNRRSVALLSEGQLVGKEIYLGISGSMRSNIWTKHTYE